MHLYLIRITITKSPNISWTLALISYQNHNYQINKYIINPCIYILSQNHNYQITKYIINSCIYILSEWQLPNHQIYHKCLHLYLIRITITKSPNISLTPALISYQNHNYQITKYIINSCIYILSESQLPNHQIYH